MIRIITLLFIAIYPIAPGYFKICKLDSGVFMSIIFCIAFYGLSIKSGIKILSKRLLLILIYSFLMIIPTFYHYEITKLLRVLVEYIAVVIALNYYFNSSDKVEEAFNIILIVCTILCFFGIYEFLTGRNFFAIFFNGSTYDLGPELQYRGNFARSETTFGHAITYAIYLSFNGILSLYLLIKTRDKKYFVSYFMIVTNIILTVSRAPIIIFFLTQFIMLFMMGYKILLKVLFYMLLLSIIALLVLFVTKPHIYRDFMEMFTMVVAVFSKTAAKKVDYISNSNPFEYRLELFKIIPSYMNGNYLMGRGKDLNFTFSMLGHTYYSIDNAYLVWMLNYGIIGLLGNIFPIITMFIIGNKKKISGHGLSKLFVCFSIIYILNLVSVAQMADYKIWIILFSISLSFDKINRKKKDFVFRSL